MTSLRYKDLFSSTRNQVLLTLSRLKDQSKYLFLRDSRVLGLYDDSLWVLLTLHPKRMVELGPCVYCENGRWVLNDNHNELYKKLRGSNGKWGKIPGQGARLARISRKPGSALERKRDGNASFVYRLKCCQGYGHRTLPMSEVFYENIGRGCHDEHLMVLADQLQAEGNPLGLLLALNLQNTSTAREEAEPLLLKAMQKLLKPR